MSVPRYLSQIEVIRFRAKSIQLRSFTAFLFFLSAHCLFTQKQRALDHKPHEKNEVHLLTLPVPLGDTPKPTKKKKEKETETSEYNLD